jgi:hypothetical protein
VIDVGEDNIEKAVHGFIDELNVAVLLLLSEDFTLASAG